MKANEVMLGDIVSLAGNPIHVTLGVLNHWSDNIKPIPLTPEILEKNGFNLHDDMYTNDVMTLHDDKKFIKTKNAWSVAVYINECYRIARCELTYVHQLQQLLRLCNIDKEIVV